ncbi:MAG: ankyrin repeat protein [Rickettsiaceae bacterium]|jgi:ankyrin repeat protein|nr:ankyrin repeat protein [Rickettsiaceae bacterium]
MKRIAEDNEHGRNVRPRTDAGQDNFILMDYSSNISIHEAAKSGDIAALALLTQNTKNIDARDAFGSTVLYQAICAGRTNAAIFMISKGANIYSLDDFNRSALHIAAQSGNVELTEFLLSRGADVNAKDDSGQTTLSLLAHEGSENDGDFAALQKLLIKHKAYINVIDYDGLAPLHITAFGRIGSARRFIENGANVNLQDDSGDTSIDIYLKVRHDQDISEFIKLLLCAGATYSKKQIKFYRDNTSGSAAAFSVFDYAKTTLTYQPIPLIPLLMLSPEFVVSYSAELRKEIEGKGSKALSKILERTGLPYLPAELIGKELFKYLSIEDVGVAFSLSSQHDQQTRPLDQGEQRVVPYSLDVAERNTRETYPAKLDEKIKLFTADIEKRRAEADKVANKGR